MMLDLAGWIAPAATMIAAMMTAANLGARVTGWGFVVFALGAAGWIVVAWASGQQNLLLSNAFLLLVDLIGIWRWLGRQARYEAGAEAAVEESADGSAPELFALGTLPGRIIHAPDGTALGQIIDAMATCGQGAIAYLVVSRGGVAGMGERLHALGWNEIRLAEARTEARIDAAALDRRPVLDPERWPGSAEEAGVGR